MNWLVFLIILIVFEITADIFAKEYSIQNKIYLFFIAILCYVLANVSWLLSMKEKSQLAISANIFSVATGIVALIIGVYFYNEIITTKQIIGICLGAIALFLLF